MSATSLTQTIGKQGLVQRADSLPLAAAQTVEALGRHVARYGLVLVSLLDWRHEVHRLRGRGNFRLCLQQPADELGLLVFSVRSFSALLGVTEIAIALLIATRPFSARAALVGSALAVGMFLTTLSFLLTTPGRLGGIGRRIPGAVRSAWTVPRQGLCVVRRIPAAVWRRLARPNDRRSREQQSK